MRKPGAWEIPLVALGVVGVMLGIVALIMLIRYLTNLICKCFKDIKSKRNPDQLDEEANIAHEENLEICKGDILKSSIENIPQRPMPEFQQKESEEIPTIGSEKWVITDPRTERILAMQKANVSENDRRKSESSSACHHKDKFR